MIVTRSNGEEVKLKLFHVSWARRQAVIDIPQYNCRLTFALTEKWVNLIKREKINLNRPDALLHVSKSVWNRDFKGVAIWANSVLRDNREQWWIVLWQTTAGEMPYGFSPVWAVSARQARYFAANQDGGNQLSVIWDNLSAIPAGRDESEARQKFSWLKQQAASAKERMLRPPSRPINPLVRPRAAIEPTQTNQMFLPF